MSAAGSRAKGGVVAAAKSRRGRWALVAVAAALVAVVVVVVVAGSTEGPATGAAAVVPADALAYAHFSTDSSRPAVASALRVASRFPTFPLIAGVVTSRLTSIADGSSSSSLRYANDIRPWLGKEAAIAFLDTATSTAGAEIVLDVKAPARARRFLAQAGASPGGSYHGVTTYRLRTGTELAFVRHYLVLGQAATVQAAIDASAGRTESLASSSAYTRAAAGEPAGRVIDTYFSPAGITRLLLPQGGVLSALGALLYQPGEIGTSVSVTPTGGGARVYVHTAIGRRRGDAVHPFTPSLASELPAGSLLLMDLTGLNREAPRVLGAGADAGIAGRLGPLLARLGTALASEGVNVKSLEALFARETAVALVPVAGGADTLVVVARTHDERRVREQLADLEVPLSSLFPTPSQGSGLVPQFSTHQVDGVAAHQVLLTPGLTLNYAVFRGLVVVSTSLGGIDAVVHHATTLEKEAAYAGALPGQPRAVTSLVFANFSQLLRLAERTGLVHGATYQALRPDLNQIRTVGIQTTSGQNDSTAQITLQIR